MEDTYRDRCFDGHRVSCCHYDDFHCRRRVYIRTCEAIRKNDAGLFIGTVGREGRPDRKVSVKGRDEIGLLAGDINKVLDAYGKMVENMLVSTGQVVTTSGMLKENANDMTTGAKKQASQANQIAAAAEEMSQTINDIAKNASSASEISANAMDMANTGKEIAQGAVATVNSVHISTVGLAEMIGKLNTKSADIGNIVTVIRR